MKPQALKKGDTIGIAASASPFEPTKFHEGVKTLESMGFKVTYQPDIFERTSYLAGSDERRTHELVTLLNNPKIKAIFFARGGYGMMRLLPFLDKHELPTQPKIVLGYSDITSLHIYLYQKYGWTTFYGPVVAKDLSPPLESQTKKSLLQAITNSKILDPFLFPKTICLKPGTTDGILVGGCLSLVVASLGTPFEIQTENKILFLEDTNEKPYAVDRMLTQLELAGKFKKARGILFGNFVNGGEGDHFKEVAADVLKNFKGPVLFNFPSGHGPVKITLPLGIQVRLNADNKEVAFLEGALNAS